MTSLYRVCKYIIAEFFFYNYASCFFNNKIALYITALNSVFLIFLAGSYILVSPNSVDAANYSFTASRFSIVGNHLHFVASSFSHTTTTFTQVGTCDDSACAQINLNSTGYSQAFSDPMTVDYTPEQSSAGQNNYFYLYDGTDLYISQNITTPTPTPTSAPHILANPSTTNVTVGTPFTVDIVVDGAGTAFNAAQADLSFDNLAVNNIFLHPSSNACDFHYTLTPTTSDPSFAGAIFGTSTITSCKVYTLSLTPTSAGTGTINIDNAHIKAYSDSSELLSSATQPDTTFTISAASPTATPTPTTVLSQLVVTSALKTYLGGAGETYTLVGTYQSPITHVFVDTSESSVTAENGNWSKPNLTLALGTNNTAHDNTFTIFGRDDQNNQTASQVVHVERHLRGDINGDGNVDLTDASLLAVDWDKTNDFNIFSDMNVTPDNAIDITDLSILAHAWTE